MVTGDGVLGVARAGTAAVRAEGAGRANWDMSGKPGVVVGEKYLSMGKGHMVGWLVSQSVSQSVS